MVDFTSAKTSVFGLPFGENHMIVGLFLSKFYHNLIDRQTGRQSVSQGVPITVLSSKPVNELTRGKNRTVCCYIGQNYY